MPERDRFHDVVRNALLKDGWTVTHDADIAPPGEETVFDLDTEPLIGAERDGERIAVAVKGFLGASELQDLYEAIGQYMLCLAYLEHSEPDRRPYLAVPETIACNFFQEPIVGIVLEDTGAAVFAFDPQREVIIGVRNWGDASRRMARAR